MIAFSDTSFGNMPRDGSQGGYMLLVDEQACTEGMANAAVVLVVLIILSGLGVVYLRMMMHFCRRRSQMSDGASGEQVQVQSGEPVLRLAMWPFRVDPGDPRARVSPLMLLPPPVPHTQRFRLCMLEVQVLTERIE